MLIISLELFHLKKCKRKLYILRKFNGPRDLKCLEKQNVILENKRTKTIRIRSIRL